jgi:hypothetical protein
MKRLSPFFYFSHFLFKKFATEWQAQNLHSKIPDTPNWAPKILCRLCIMLCRNDARQQGAKT